MRKLSSTFHFRRHQGRIAIEHSVQVEQWCHQPYWYRRHRHRSCSARHLAIEFPGSSQEPRTSESCSVLQIGWSKRESSRSSKYTDLHTAGQWNTTMTFALQILTHVFCYVPYALVLRVIRGFFAILCSISVFEAITSPVPCGNFASVNVEIVSNYDSCCSSVKAKNSVLPGLNTHIYAKNDDEITDLQILQK